MAKNHAFASFYSMDKHITLVHVLFLVQVMTRQVKSLVFFYEVFFDRARQCKVPPPCTLAENISS